MAIVLVIEDSPTNMMLAVQILTLGGHTALEAADASTGIALAREASVDAILMDMHLPDLDGLAATRQLKDDPATCAIPVIALTASAMKGDRERALAAGCQAYVEKPVRYKNLLGVIAALTSP